MKKVTIAEINKGSFVCACGKHLSGNDKAIIHVSQSAITCEACAETLDKRLLVYDCRIFTFLNEHVQTAIPETVLYIRRSNFRKTFDKVNAIVSNRRAFRIGAPIQLNVMEQLIWLAKFAA